jgi:signal transduction histidine kinase
MIQNKDRYTEEELIKKYRLAGKIRFISFFLLLFFLILMKYIGGYAYLNNTFIALVFIEAILNQPYGFFLSGVNTHRFQYYQMATDIIAISWIMYYMGGLEAPIVTIAYYAVILWAGVASTTAAVFFAVFASAVLFSLVVVSEHLGLIPPASLFEYSIPTIQMIVLLLGNISFMFAFGYFSAHSSGVIKYLQIKRQEESLRNAHKLVATGSLVGYTAHDILNQLSCIKGYAEILLGDKSLNSYAQEMIESIRKLEQKSAALVERLAKFSRETEPEFDVVDIRDIFKDALQVCWPLIRYSKMEIQTKFASDLPHIMANRSQLQEVFVIFLINSMDAISKRGVFTIETRYNREDGLAEMILSDTGRGIKEEDLKRLGSTFFTTKGMAKGLGLGLLTAYGIISRHNGKVSVESTVGKGTAFLIQLPVRQSQQR